ncbi:MAG: GNAT family N-acetyltransferase [Dehalococcoidia bacterium]
MDFVQAGARNWAAWHDSQLRAHGLECRRTGSLWSCRQRGGGIYLGALTLSAVTGDERERLAEIEELVAARRSDDFTLVDSWMELDLVDLGFELGDAEPWYVRSPEPPATGSSPSEPEIEQVADAAGLKGFEKASLEGFETTRPRELGTFGIHAVASLKDPRLRYFTGRVAGRVVSVSMSYVSDGVVGVYGVATPPEYRCRGYGEALTWAAIMADPGLPTVLQPSEMAASLYRKMGFAEVGKFRRWHYRGNSGS